MKADTQTITIDADWRKVFEFVAQPRNLPHWARAFCQAIRLHGDAWLVTSPQGEVRVRYRTDAAVGVIDFHLTPAPGVEAFAASRVVPNGTGSEYVFTQFQTPLMPDDLFTRQVHALQQELVTLKALLEGRPVEGAPSCAPGESRDGSPPPGRGARSKSIRETPYRESVDLVGRDARHEPRPSAHDSRGTAM